MGAALLDDTPARRPAGHYRDAVALAVAELRPPRRIAWFADLETLVERLDLLRELRDQIGLTTLVPESHISHTSGFAASPEIASSSPLRDWRERPGLRDHRDVFGVAEPAMAVLPGIVGGVDDGPLLRVIDECRRLGLEVWGHAGLWSYGAEVFPELAAVDLFGRTLLPDSLPWGTMFCPSKAALNDWIARSLADVAARYDLDGWFVDHARYTSPGHGPTLLACGCADCAAAALWSMASTSPRVALTSSRSSTICAGPTRADWSPWPKAAPRQSSAGSRVDPECSPGSRFGRGSWPIASRSLPPRWQPRRPVPSSSEAMSFRREWRCWAAISTAAGPRAPRT